MNKTTALTATLTAAGLTLGTTSANATVILQEQFEYGDTAEPLAGNNGGTGWAAPWTDTSSSGAATVAYTPTGLTLSNLVVDGGAANLSLSSQASARGARSHSASATDTIFGSYLFNLGTVTGPTVAAVLNDPTSNPNENAADIAAVADRFGASGQGQVKTNNNSSNLAGTNVSAGVTYLSLFKASGLDPALSQSVTITEWILTEAQFDNFKNDDGTITESELNSASTGSGSGSVLQRGSVTANTNAGFDAGDFISLFHFNQGPSSNIIFDELRVSDTSLDEVTPIPEPASLALLGLGGLLMLPRRKRA